MSTDQHFNDSEEKKPLDLKECRVRAKSLATLLQKELWIMKNDLGYFIANPDSKIAWGHFVEKVR